MKPRVSEANAGFRLHFISVLLSFVSMTKVFEFGHTNNLLPTETLRLRVYVVVHSDDDWIFLLLNHDLVKLLFFNIMMIMYHYMCYIV